MLTRTRILLASIGIALAGSSLAANSAQSVARENSPDLVSPSAAGQQAQAKQAGPITTTLTVADVGDVDSFGRAVKYIGVTQTGVVNLLPDCTPAPGDPPLGPDDRCVTLVPEPGITNFAFNDLGRINLPAKATNSLLCHALTSFPFWHFNNTSGAPAPAAQFRFGASFTVENALLSDPSLIDPTTGLPFNGSLLVSFSSLLQDGRFLDVGEQATQRQITTRDCLAGTLSKRSLMETYGLTSAQADNFFKNPMTIRFNLNGSASFVDQAQVFYGVRYYGD